jgi:hypothetical protein
MFEPQTSVIGSFRLAALLRAVRKRKTGIATRNRTALCNHAAPCAALLNVDPYQADCSRKFDSFGSRAFHS